jgi:hypothetical protein
MDDRKIPESEECPNCKEQNCVHQTLSGAPALVGDSRDMHSRAGSEFNNRLKQIKKGSGRNNTIKHI